MRRILTAGVLAATVVLLAPIAGAEDKEPKLYSKLHGAKDAAPPPVVFLHGGPGFNSVAFELTTAAALGELTRTVVYDRAGCGRSGAGSWRGGSFTFKGAISDLHRVMKEHEVERPLLVGQSFGGTLALKAFDADPEAYSGVLLIGSPVSYPDALDLIAKRCRKFYEEIENPYSLKSLDGNAKLDKDSVMYAGTLFGQIKAAPEAHLLSDMKMPPFIAFVMAEKYTTMDLEPLVKKHAKHVFGIYGAEDWALGETGRKTLEDALPKGHFVVIEGASHSVFADKQPEFLAAMGEMLTTLRARAEKAAADTPEKPETPEQPGEAENGEEADQPE